MIKTLGAYVKEFKRASIATPCYMILEVLMEMMIPYLMASIIDDGVNKGDMKHIYVVGIASKTTRIGSDTVTSSTDKCSLHGVYINVQKQFSAILELVRKMESK